VALTNIDEVEQSTYSLLFIYVAC